MKKLQSIICLAIIFICSSVLLTACGSSVKFKIKFMVDNEEYAVVDTAGNETISMPENPVKLNYVFDGWYWDENVWQNPFTANSLLDQSLNSDMKVYAKWSDDKELKGTRANFIDFKQVDSSIYKISVSNATEILNLSDYVEVSNKSSWQLTTDIQAINNIPSKIATLNIGDNTYYVLVTTQTGDVKLYTLNIRRRPIYIVSFDEYGEPQQVEEDSYAKQPENPERVGYIFAGWNFDFSSTIQSDTCIIALWTANEYEIKYCSNNDLDIEETVDVTYDENFITPQNDLFTRDDYILDEFNTKQDGTGVTYSLNTSYPYRYDSDLILYAIWKGTNYNIDYILDDGINSVDNPSVYNIESPTFTLKDAEKEFYIFCGWFIDKNFQNQITQVEKGTTGNLKFYAKFEPADELKYKLSNDKTYYSVVGYFGNPEKILIKENYNELPVREISAYAFSNNLNLKTIVIPKTILNIGEYAFSGCNNITSLFIPGNVTNVGPCAFYGWNSNQLIYCEFAYPYDTIQCDVQISIDGSGILIPISYTPVGICLGPLVIQMPYCSWQNGWQDECNAQILWYGRDWKYVSGIPTANAGLSEQQGWLAYKAKVDYYNQMATGKLQQLGNLLALWNNAQTIEDKYEYLQSYSYQGTFETLEAEITMNWNSLVSLYNSVVKNQKPTNNYADPQFAISIYKPIIEFNITNQAAEQLTVAEINGAMVNNCLNSGKVTVNLLIDSEGIVNETVAAAYRLIDWAVYGPAYKDDERLTNVADIYITDSNLNGLSYFDLALTNTTWEGQGGIRYFLTYQTNSNNSFYEHSQVENFVLKENSYFSRKGICFDGETIYYYYEGTILINL
ncbi:MAG: InlB B-repeat-containing protein [Eubacteriales bacterium]|nr:InlB B-repeat-containing protein [Eubacteriales bacterium]